MKNINDIEDTVESFTEAIKSIEYVFKDETLAKQSSELRDKMIDAIDDFMETIYKDEEQEQDENQSLGKEHLTFLNCSIE